MRRRSEWTTTASRSAGPSSPGHPLDLHVPEPVNVMDGSKVSWPPLRTNRSVAWALRSGRTPELAVLEDLGMPERDHVPGAPDREAHPAHEVLAEVDERAPQGRSTPSRQAAPPGGAPADLRAVEQGGV